ncbi:transglycosylase SLT domain-containing protein [Photobacterium kishitanii]|nr:transglycosylase SLT domain-containing protein [Photobacterium kishitanii]
MRFKKLKIAMCAMIILSCSGCSSMIQESVGTKTPSDACKTLTQNKDWMVATHKAYRRWGIPISVQLSVIRHESSFNRDASATTSSAYGYAQALNDTWKEYKKATNNKTASRGSFFDSTDFIGWYWNEAQKKIHFSPYNARAFYLSYHEGIGGYQRRSYLKKTWLMKKSKTVQMIADKYRFQLNKCRLEI